MKKGIALLLVVVVLVFAAHSFVRAAEVIKLKAANYLPVTHPMSLLSGWFCDEVKKRTNGRVEITYYPGGTLLTPVKMYDGIVTGIADMGVSHILIRADASLYGDFRSASRVAERLGVDTG